MKRLFLFILLLTAITMVAALALAGDIPPEDAADPYSLPALGWDNAGIGVSDWIAAFLKSYEEAEPEPDEITFTLRWRGVSDDKDCLFYSACLRYSEIFLGVWDTDTPMLTGVNIQITDDLINLADDEIVDVIDECDAVLSAILDSLIAVFNVSDSDEAAEAIDSLRQYYFVDLLWGEDDEDFKATVTFSQDISALFYIYFEEDMMFLTFGFDFISGDTAADLLEVG